MQKFFVVAGLLVLLQVWLTQSPQGGPPCRSDEAVGRDNRRCQNRDLRFDEPTSMEDQLIERQLVEQGSRLINSGQTVDTRVLIKQLERESCRLQLPQTAAVPRDPVQLYRSARDAVVVVAGLYKCRKCTRWHTSTASGFAIGAQGFIATNHHVVNDANLKTIVVMTADQRVYPVQEVMAASRSHDVAILKIAANDLNPLPIANDRAAALVGSDVSVVSHPDGNFYSYTSGIISRYMKIRSAGKQVDAVSITADYARGSSGAPVLNQFGQVVAVVMSTDSVYYTENSRQQRDLQMVFKTCIPSTSLMKLVREPKGEPAVTTPLASR